MKTFNQFISESIKITSINPSIGVDVDTIGNAIENKIHLLVTTAWKDYALPVVKKKQCEDEYYEIQDINKDLFYNVNVLLWYIYKRNVTDFKFASITREDFYAVYSKKSPLIIAGKKAIDKFANDAEKEIIKIVEEDTSLYVKYKKVFDVCRLKFPNWITRGVETDLLGMVRERVDTSMSREFFDTASEDEIVLKLVKKTFDNNRTFKYHGAFSKDESIETNTETIGNNIKMFGDSVFQLNRNVSWVEIHYFDNISTHTFTGKDPVYDPAYQKMFNVFNKLIFLSNYGYGRKNMNTHDAYVTAWKKVIDGFIEPNDKLKTLEYLTNNDVNLWDEYTNLKRSSDIGLMDFDKFVKENNEESSNKLTTLAREFLKEKINDYREIIRTEFEDWNLPWDCPFIDEYIDLSYLNGDIENGKDIEKFADNNYHVNRDSDELYKIYLEVADEFKKEAKAKILEEITKEPSWYAKYKNEINSAGVKVPKWLERGEETNLMSIVKETADCKYNNSTETDLDVIYADFLRLFKSWFSVGGGSAGVYFEDFDIPEELKEEFYMLYYLYSVSIPYDAFNLQTKKKMIEKIKKGVIKSIIKKMEDGSVFNKINDAVKNHPTKYMSMDVGRYVMYTFEKAVKLAPKWVTRGGATGLLDFKKFNESTETEVYDKFNKKFSVWKDSNTSYRYYDILSVACDWVPDIFVQDFMKLYYLFKPDIWAWNTETYWENKGDLNMVRDMVYKDVEKSLASKYDIDINNYTELKNTLDEISSTHLNAVADITIIRTITGFKELLSRVPNDISRQKDILWDLKRESYINDAGKPVDSIYVGATSRVALNEYVERTTPEEMLCDLVVFVSSNRISVNNGGVVYTNNSDFKLYPKYEYDEHDEIMYLEVHDDRHDNFDNNDSFSYHKHSSKDYIKILRLYTYLTDIFTFGSDTRFTSTIKIYNSVSDEYKRKLRHFVKSSSLYHYFLRKWMDNSIPEGMDELEVDNKVKYINFLKKYDLWTKELDEEYGHYVRSKDLLWDIKTSINND